MRQTAMWVGIACVLFGGALPGTTYADVTPCNPKVDNFVLFVDQSGSMYQTHESGEVKEILVKRLLDQMNEQIPRPACPSCGLRGGLYLFAPFAEVKEVGVYYQDSMRTRISWIPDSQPVSRLTPMGGGIEDLEGVVSPLKGKTADHVLGRRCRRVLAAPCRAAQVGNSRMKAKRMPQSGAPVGPST